VTAAQTAAPAPPPMPTPPQAPPRVTAAGLADGLRARQLFEPFELIELLGEARNHLTLADLERALARDGRVGQAALVELKSQISGYPPVPADITSATAALPRDLSQATGAVALSASPPVVAMVEDLPESVARIEQHLNGPFEIRVCTLPQFLELHNAAYTGTEILAKPALTDIYEVFDQVITSGASDMHLSVGAPPALRVDGKLTYLQVQPPDQAWMRREILRIGGEARLRLAEEQYNADFAFAYGTARFRVNAGAEAHGLTVAARKIPVTLPTMDEIRLPAVVRKLTTLERGLVLVTGPTGSGKSTTLASMLGSIARTQPKHLITLEDPVEFTIPHGASVVHQRELGASFTSFSDGLRQALRQDPDVVLVGEMRDIETIRTALTAAETGHLVFGTLHTYDAASTVARIVSAFPAEEQDQIRGMLSHILQACISQTLLPLAAGSGRAAAYEVMLSTPAIAANLRKTDGHAQLKQTIATSVREGMQTMDLALAELVRRRVVTEHAALEKASSAEHLRELLDS